MKNKTLKTILSILCMQGTFIVGAHTMESIQNDPFDTPHAETRLLYLEDTYTLEGEAKVVRIGSDEKKGPYVVLDQTLFYPQGGGQPSDKGFLKAGDQTYGISFVGFAEGQVLHHSKDPLDGLMPGTKVSIHVDKDARLLHAKSHTAGHLLDAATRELAPELIGKKGYHFLEGPYVEFEGVLKSHTPEVFTEKLNALMQKAIEEDRGISKALKEPSFLANLMLPTGFSIPEGKPCRVVDIGGFNAVPCGGTHLKSLKELKEVKVKKVQVQAGKNQTKVSYTFL